MTQDMKTVHNTARLIPDISFFAQAHLNSKLIFALRALNIHTDKFLSTKMAHAYNALGNFASLEEAVSVNVKTLQSDTQSVIDGIVQENERGFSHTFASPTDISHGRRALHEFVQYLNGRNATNVVNDYTVTNQNTVVDILESMSKNPDIEAISKGSTWLLAGSFQRDTKNAKTNRSIQELNIYRSDLLSTIFANSVAYMGDVFEEFRTGNENTYFTGVGSKIYSQYTALALTLIASRSYGDSLQAENNDGNRPKFKVGVTAYNILHALHEVCVKYLSTRGKNFKEKAQKDVDNLSSENHLNKQNVAQGFELLDGDSDKISLEDVDAYTSVAIYLFTYDFETGKSVFEDKNNKNPLATILEHIAEVAFTLETAKLEESAKLNLEEFSINEK